MKKSIYFLAALGLLSLYSCSDNTTEAVADTTETEPKTVYLDTTTYEIIGTKHYPAVQNFYVLIKTETRDKDSLQVFVDNFRKDHCYKCNINIYDTDSVKSIMTMYPIPDDKYLYLAEHYVAGTDFETRTVYLYPYQDLKYKELGGKNWKKEPMK